MRILPSDGAIPGVLLLLAACNEVEDSQIRTTLSDSAGIRIVQNASPAAAPLYSVSGPVFEIGRVAGGEEYELYNVNSVARMRSLAGDSLLVFDSGNRRVNILAPDGAYARSESIGLDDERPVTVAAALRDGTLLTRTVLETPRATTPLYRTPLGFVVDRRGATVPLPSYPGPEAALHVAGSGGDVGLIFISILPFARAAYATAGPRHFFVGSSDTYQIDVWNETGQLVRIIRAASPVRLVTDDIQQEYVSLELQRMRLSAAQRGRPFDEAQARRQLNDQAHAPAVPAYSALLAGADGGLWVRDFALPGVEPASERWTIFDDAGNLAARVVLPAGFTPLHVEAELVLGVFRDSLDVPYVHGYVVK